PRRRFLSTRCGAGQSCSAASTPFLTCSNGMEHSGRIGRQRQTSLEPGAAWCSIRPANASCSSAVMKARPVAAAPKDSPLLPPPPIIVQQPESRTVSLGGTATFSVVASGAGPFVFQWRALGSPVHDGPGGLGAGGGVVAGSATATLTVGRITGRDYQYLDCLVSNTCGGLASNGASLIVGPCGSAAYDNDGTPRTAPHITALFSRL